MRAVAGRNLWVGNAGDVADPRTMLAAGVEAVVEVADNEPGASLPRHLIRLRFPISDGGANPPWLLRLAAESAAALLQARVPTLVCCSAGISRSVCIAAAGLALAESASLAVSLRTVAGAGATDVSPGLLKQLEDAISG